MRLALFSLAAAAIVTLETQPADAAQCVLPDILVLLDASGSMVTGGTPTKWTQAKAGIDAALSTYQDRAYFGLSHFPNPSDGEPATAFAYCDVATSFFTAVPFQLNARAPIATYLGSLTPKATWDTPLKQALDMAARVPEMSGQRPYVLLISDGQQDCCKFGDYDPEPDCDSISPQVFNSTETGENREDIEEVVRYLKFNNIPVYAVGFGANADALTLNRVAAAAGTQRYAGCNEFGTNPANGNNCYYKASDSAGLSAALAQIVQQIETEVCDGFDNDCDGPIDENLTRNCSTCLGGGTETCSGGVYQGCTAPAPRTETCNNVDDDCDGSKDENLIRPCGNCLGTGIETCSNGSYGGCTAPALSAEVCDGIDNDCDGRIDEQQGISCQCDPNPTTGDPPQVCGPANVGECKSGWQYCITAGGGGEWGPCTGAKFPSSELCDGKDNDCDGYIDDGAQGTCTTACGPGFRPCTNGSLEPVCIVLDPPAEICDGEDNNCNGVVDEGSDEPCMTACGAGLKKCVAGSLGACVALNPPVEVCDGRDNNCDGVVDEGCACTHGSERPCGGKTGGECTEGKQRCEYGKWTECIGANNGRAEECNGIDDDCNGKIDDGADICGAGQACVCGACQPECTSDSSCANGGKCVLGVCQIDYCPADKCCTNGKCEDGACVLATQPLSVPPVIKDEKPLADPSRNGKVRGGCGCSAVTAIPGDLALLGLGVMAALLVARRRQRT